MRSRCGAQACDCKVVSSRMGAAQLQGLSLTRREGQPCCGYNAALGSLGWMLIAAVRQLVSSRCTACRVGIELEKVEVRLKGLTVRARATAAGRALPSIFNSYRNWIEVPARLLWCEWSKCTGVSRSHLQPSDKNSGLVVTFRSARHL